MTLRSSCRPASTFIVVTVFFVMFNEAMMPFYGYYMPWYFCAGVFMIIGGSLMAGSTLQLGYSVAATKVEPHDVPAAVGFINTAPAGTGTVALTIAGSLFQNIAFENLKIACTDKNYSSRDLRSVVAGTQSDIFRSASAEVRDASIGAIINAIDKVSAMAIAAGALIFVCSIFMKREKLFVVPATGG